MTDEMTMAKRRLGTSHWDKKLVTNMVALSVSNDYEEAHKEWIATGDVWWRGQTDNIPTWVQQNNHPMKCLCGHDIVYHFRIQNTENGNEDIVGSDHINSYLIIRAIAKETGMRPDEITEELIQQWLNVRVKGMKAEAWWAENGKSFELMFNTVKEADLRYNTKVKDWKYNYDTRRSEPVYKLIKKASPTDEMASIVWRWNHPDNSRAQINSRGYPNEKLMYDLSVFYIKCLTGLNDQLQAEKLAREERIAQVAEQQRIRQEEEARRQAEYAEIQRQRELERKAYEEKMRPIWEEEARQREIKRKKAEARERNDLLLHMATHGSKADKMIEYYGLEPINWQNINPNLSLHDLRTLHRYINSDMKNLDRSDLRRIEEITKGDKE